MIARLIIFLFFFLTELGGACMVMQASWVEDSLLAENFTDKSIGWVIEGAKDSADYYQEKALCIFEEYDELYNWIGVYSKLGKSLRDRRKFAKSLDYYRAPLNARFREPKNENEWTTLAWTAFYAGYSSKSINNYKQALSFYESSKHIFVDTLGREDPTVTHYIYIPIGNIYTRLGDYQKSEYYLKRAEKILYEAGKNNWAAQARRDYTVVLQSTGNDLKAIELLEESLAWKGLSEMEVFFIKSLLAESYLKVGKLQEALVNNQAAEIALKFSISNKLYRNGERFLGSIFENYANIYLAQENYQLAKENLQNALEFSLEYYSTPYKREIGKIYVHLGEIHRLWGKPDSAIIYSQKGLKSVLPDFEFNDPLENPLPTSFYAENTILEALSAKALACRDLAEIENEVFYLQKAIECYKLTFIVDRKLRDTYEYTSSDLEILEEAKGRYEKMIEIAFRLWDLTKEEDYLTQAFEWSERSKSLLLREALRKADAVSTSKVPDNLLALDKDLQDQIANLEQERFKEQSKKTKADQQKLTEISDSIFVLTEKRSKLERQFEINHPQYYQAKYDIKIPSLSEVQDLLKSNSSNYSKSDLDKGQALVEYFLSDQNAFIFIIDSHHKHFFVKKIDWNDSISSMVRTIKEDIFDFKNVAYAHKARILYKHLVEPVLELTRANNLIIVPDEELWNLPFDALLTKDISEDEKRNFADLPYLVKESCISYAFSASMLKEMRKPSKSINRKLLAYAPSYRNIGNQSSNSNEDRLVRNELNPLFFNEEEGENIVDVYGGTLIRKSEATKNHFLQSSSKGGVMHIAAHAKSNNQEPNFSFIAFTNVEDTLDSSYKLYVNELYNYPLPFEMAVLSACETGTGPVWKGEGLISISRAFVYGGTKSIVTSLWSISDFYTKDIMISFYSNLKKGEPKDKALQNAKLAYIENSIAQNQAHPFYWAAFTPIGNMKPLVTFPPFLVQILYGSLIVGFIFFAVFFLWKKRKYFFH